MDCDKYVTSLASNITGLSFTSESEEAAALLRGYKEAAKWMKHRKVASDDLEPLHRKLFLTCVLNADGLGKDTKAAMSSKYVHLNRIVKVSSGALAEVWRQRWAEDEKFFLESVALLPKEISVKMVRLVLEKEKVLQFSVVAASLQAFRREQIEEADMLEVLKRLPLPCKTVSELATSMAQLLFLLRLANESKFNLVVDMPASPEKFYLDVPSEDSGYEAKCSTKVMAVLETAYKVLANTLNVSMWLDMVELPASEVLGCKVRLWSAPQEVPPPGNMQQLVAHLAHECRKFYLSSSSSEVKEMLGGIAREHTAARNLDLHDKDIIDILALASEDPETCLAFLLENKIEEVVTNKDALKMLRGKNGLLKPFLPQLWNRMKTDAGCKNELKMCFFDALSDAGDADQCSEYLREAILLESDMRTSEFDSGLTVFLNRACSEETSALQVDLRPLFCSAIQSPLGVLERLVRESIESRGKMTVMAELLVQLGDLAILKLKTESLDISLEEMSLNEKEMQKKKKKEEQFAVVRMAMYLYSELETELPRKRSHLLLFVERLSESNAALRVAFSSSLLLGLVSDPMAHEGCLRLLSRIFTGAVIQQIDDPMGLKLCVLADTYAVDGRPERRQIIIDLLLRLSKGDPKMRKTLGEYLTPFNRSFFCADEAEIVSLKSALDAHYALGEATTPRYTFSSGDQVLEAAQCLPNLLPDQYGALFDLLGDSETFAALEMFLFFSPEEKEEEPASEFVSGFFCQALLERIRGASLEAQLDAARCLTRLLYDSSEGEPFPGREPIESAVGQVLGGVLEPEEEEDDAEKGKYDEGSLKEVLAILSLVSGCEVKELLLQKMQIMVA